MGYTNYWEIKRDLTPSEWAKVKKSTKSIIKKARARGICLAGGDGEGSPEIGRDFISLNGCRRKEMPGTGLGQARETLREAEILLQESALRGAVNRAYYAMFYAVMALLATKRIGTSKHSGILALFDREFVKLGLLSRELSRSLHLAFERRQTYDYGEVMPVTCQVAKEALTDARSFVMAVETYLHSAGYDTVQEQ